MLKENKYFNGICKKCFDKKIVMTIKDDEDFDNSTKCCICDNAHVDSDVKVIDHSHIKKKFRGSAHRDCNAKVKLNHKTLVIFHNLKNYDSHLIMQELDKFNFKNKRHTKWIRKICEL